MNSDYNTNEYLLRGELFLLIPAYYYHESLLIRQCLSFDHETTTMFFIKSIKSDNVTDDEKKIAVGTFSVTF